MGVVERLLKRLDENINGPADRHLSLAIPEPRPVMGYDCCGCCAERFAPASCPLVPHRRPCAECQDVA